jgi:acetyl esterase/lipase
MSDYIGLVDPELRAAARQMRETMASFADMSREKLEKRRAWIDSMALPPLPDVSVSEHHIKRSGADTDAPDVTVFVVNAKPGATGPGILHIHGGGFTASRAVSGLRNVQALAVELDCPVVTVDYRLAPETIYSGSLKDNYAALRWMHEQASAIGVDPQRIGVLGESAGGGHAALLSVAARDRGEFAIAFQALIYPMLDDRTGTTRRVPEHIGYFGWNAEANRFGWESFLGLAPGGPHSPEGAVPARVENLSGLPPTFIGVGALDLFVEESIAYAARLLAAAVPTELLVVPGAFHGFDVFIKDATISQRFTAAKLSALRRGLGLL